MKTRKPLIERLRTARKNEDGLALLDVLIGMAIFALIALIALSALGQYRQKAYMTGAASDAKAIGNSIEAEGVTQANYPTAVVAGTESYEATYGTETANLARITEGKTIQEYAVLPATATEPEGFEFCIVHESNGVVSAWAAYNSREGGLIDQGDTTPAATDPATCS